ncbi:MAG: DNA primase [bacterium]
MDNLEQIKSRINIVDLIREYIEIKKAGANWKALCPFHSEKSPSFMISEDKQIWHCFGCNEGGDIFSFVMKMESIDFPEALRLLAKKAGVVLQRQDPAINSEKTKLMDILETAADFFAEELRKSEAALNYVKARGLSGEILSEFRIGFSPQSWDGLIKKMQSQSVALKDVVLAGLAIEKDGNFFDRFRGRVMFPIFNHYGNVVGFTARVLPEFDDGKSGKYINTPETAVYKKSEILYGLNFAKQDIKKANAAVVVEGNMDAITLHQAGFKNVVATSGTALTNEQLNILKRHAENLIISFDADSAGINAALRGIDLALMRGFNVKVLEMPKNESGAPAAKDPDELVRKFPGLWKNAVNSPKHIIEFYINANIIKFNMGEPHEVAKFCGLILSEIGKIKNSVERALWIKRLAEISGVAEADLRASLLRKKAGNLEQNQSENKKIAEAGSFELKYIALILTDANKFSSEFNVILPEMMEDASAGEFYKNLIYYYNNARPFSIKGLEGWFYSIGKHIEVLEWLMLLKDKDYAEYGEDEIERELKDLREAIKKKYLNKKCEELKQAISAAERDGDKKRRDELMVEFNKHNQLKI